MSRKGPIHSLWLFYLLSDVAAIAAAYFCMLYLRFFSALGQKAYGGLNRLLSVGEPASLGDNLQLFYSESAPRIILILCLSMCLLYAFLNLYEGRRFLLRRPVAPSVIIANVIALTVYYSYFYVRFNVFHPRTVFVSIAFFNILFCTGFRAALDRLLEYLRLKRHLDECRALLVGSGDEEQTLHGLITARHPQGILVAERIAYDAQDNGRALVDKIRRCAAHNRIDMIICADNRLAASDLMRILQLSEELRVAVKVFSKEMNVLLTRARLPLDVILDTPVVHFAGPRQSAFYFSAKKAASVIAAAAALVLLSPLLLLIALVVKLTSKGPVFFIQERIGVNRRPFRMYKFRTMHQLADELQAQVEEFNESGAGLFKIRKDPRVTLAGRFLRRFSLDELPQLINVIRGDMALVGPRPLPRRDFEHYYEDWHYIRHGGLPGLTCLWQVSGRSDIDFHNMCILDVYYLRNQSLLLDLQILLKTVLVVFFAKGAY